MIIAKRTWPVISLSICRIETERLIKVTGVTYTNSGDTSETVQATERRCN